MSLTIDPYLFQMGVTGLPGSDLSELERLVHSEVARLQNESVPDQELQRAVRQLEAQFVYSSEGMTNQAYWLGLCEIVDGWQRASSLPEEIRGVTAEDIQHDLDRRSIPLPVLVPALVRQAPVRWPALANHCYAASVTVI